MSKLNCLFKFSPLIDNFLRNSSLFLFTTTGHKNRNLAGARPRDMSSLIRVRSYSEGDTFLNGTMNLHAFKNSTCSSVFSYWLSCVKDFHYFSPVRRRRRTTLIELNHCRRHDSLEFSYSFRSRSTLYVTLKSFFLSLAAFPDLPKVLIANQRDLPLFMCQYTRRMFLIDRENLTCWMHDRLRLRAFVQEIVCWNSFG